MSVHRHARALTGSAPAAAVGHACRKGISTPRDLCVVESEMYLRRRPEVLLRCDPELSLHKGRGEGGAGAGVTGALKKPALPFHFTSLGSSRGPISGRWLALKIKRGVKIHGEYPRLWTRRARRHARWKDEDSLHEEAPTPRHQKAQGASLLPCLANPCERCACGSLCAPEGPCSFL